ncbi:hypothetical protein MKEN_01182200 [Mycena kentingensis (nom. inval.)]|nr:hypothetical protein MKEN_01182200 [Mycena kentingensis (nom. inval.)]
MEGFIRAFSGFREGVLCDCAGIKRGSWASTSEGRWWWLGAREICSEFKPNRTTAYQQRGTYSSSFCFRTMSISSSQSFDMLTSPISSQWSVHGDDASDDDYVLLSRRHSPSPDALAAEFARMNVAPATPSPKRRNRRRRPSAAPSQSPSPPPTPAPIVKSAPHRRKQTRSHHQPEGLGARPIVDDLSSVPDSASEAGDDDALALLSFKHASSHISAFLEDNTSTSILTLLQSLVVELGLVTSASPSLLPASLTQARAILKSRAFVNISEYLVARQHGPSAIQEIMHPSRSALIRDLRRNRNRVKKEQVKASGLSVLLVRCFHH